MRDYFCGWYFKCRSDSETIAVIPAVHCSKGEWSCSLQCITERGAVNLTFPYEDFQKEKGEFLIRVGKNSFGREGIRLDIRQPDFSAVGEIRFGEFFPLRYDIMGPFRFVPFMECRHSVFSMAHRLWGELRINGEIYCFRDGVGYIEGDRGYSFPEEYAWTQCDFNGGSLMLSVAHIPLGALHFTGVIGAVLWQGKEYRIATYLGANAVKIKDGEIVVRQGNSILRAKLLEKRPHPLSAPIKGVMKRTIHESAVCRAFYCFQHKGKTLFSFESDGASFEYEYS